MLFTPAYTNLWTEELLATDPNLAVIKAMVSVTDPFLGQSWPANLECAASMPSARRACSEQSDRQRHRRAHVGSADAVKDAAPEDARHLRGRRHPAAREAALCWGGR